MRVLAKAFPLLMVLHLAASPADGQSILVHVIQSETGIPISGAFVSLLDSQDRVIRSALTNETGRFLFSAPGPGAYRVKGEMIGRDTRSSPSVTVRGRESSSVELSLPVFAIPLAGIQVEAEGRCRVRPDEASELARVWEEARTALAVQAWTEEEGLYRLAISTYDRDLDGSGRTVEREHRRGTTTVTRTPFVSLPVEDLMSAGFVRPLEDGGHQYYGPDAQVLLSDLFLDTHCFRLARSDDLPGSIGLTFEPVSSGDVADVEGTLWLDQETGALQLLEFGYTAAPYREAQGVAGGRIEFEAMPSGAWIIKKWWIRAPIVARQRYLSRGADSGLRVAAIRETGGEVTRATTLNEQKILEAERGSLTGLVWDSTRSGPLEGATVYLSGTQFSSVTDEEGRFQAEGLPGGVFTASFTHPRLDSLGILGPKVEVEVSPGRASEIRLAVPSTETILVASCRTQEEGTGVLSGTVSDRGSGRPVPGARVRVEWQRVLGLDPVRAKDEWVEVRANSDGSYAACGIPLDGPFQIHATFLERSGDPVEGTLQDEEHKLLDLAIDLPEGILTDRSAGTYMVEEYGAQGVQGVLVEPGSGDPVRGAEVSLIDGSGKVAVTGITNQKGFFRLQAAAPGRYILNAQALGYATVEAEVVEVSLGQLAVLEVEMPPEALELEPIVVTAERRSFHLEMEGFYERKELGGIFITPEVLEERKPRKVSDVFFGLPGVRVGEQSLGAGGRGIWFRVGERGAGAAGSPGTGSAAPFSVCWPMVFVDRYKVSNGGLIKNGPEPTAADDFVHGLDVSAIEVYRGASEIPAEFNGPNAGCGVIVIWTKKGGGGG